MPKPLPAVHFEILLSLADQDLHGYALIRDVEARTQGEMRLTASTLYDAIKRLLASGWIEELALAPGEDARRRVYRLTRTGRAVGHAEAARLDALAAEARRKGFLPKLRRS
jgi:DNA-binding PadR family transcriptional regulator